MGFPQSNCVIMKMQHVINIGDLKSIYASYSAWIQHTIMLSNPIYLSTSSDQSNNYSCWIVCNSLTHIDFAHQLLVFPSRLYANDLKHLKKHHSASAVAVPTSRDPSRAVKEKQTTASPQQNNSYC